MARDDRGVFRFVLTDSVPDHAGHLPCSRSRSPSSPVPTRLNTSGCSPSCPYSRLDPSPEGADGRSDRPSNRRPLRRLGDSGCGLPEQEHGAKTDQPDDQHVRRHRPRRPGRCLQCAGDEGSEPAADHGPHGVGERCAAVAVARLEQLPRRTPPAVRRTDRARWSRPPRSARSARAPPCR